MKKIIIMSLFLALVGCQKATVQVEKPVFTLDTYPVVDGSTVTIPFSEALMADLTSKTIEEVRPYVLHNKTHEAYVNLINGSADIIFVTSPSAEELQLATTAGVEMEVIPIVSEAFVFITHKDNPVNNLTIEQIQKIYTGEISNWKDVGGADVAIRPFQRPVNSGSQTGFLDLVMKTVVPMVAPTELVSGGMGELIEAIATYKNQADAIGYTYYYYVTDMWTNTNVKLLNVNGVYPNPTTIANGKYPIHTSYYAVIRKTEAVDSDVRKMIAYILSDAGQTLAEGAGYVKVD